VKRKQTNRNPPWKKEEEKDEALSWLPHPGTNLNVTVVPNTNFI